jgi:glycosyltransferase involved in cell wall biosynthesis
VHPRIDILLATYNGAAFLAEQLASLMEQDYPNFGILIRDDGSTDDTLKIIADWERKHPENIKVLRDHQRNLGATGNFNALMQSSDAAYIAFSDQDDYWLPHKLSTQLKALQNLENGDPTVPAFVFCDLKYCDAHLKVIHPSLITKDKLSPDKTQTHRLLMQNVPYGCAMMLNRSLLLSATPIPSEALLHDHWLAISASLIGKIAFVPEALILHRVHTSNASRAASAHKKEASAELGSKVSNKNFHNYLFKQTAQAKALLHHFQHKISAEQKRLLNDFVLLETTSGWERKQIILKNRFFKNTFAHTLKLVLRA